VAHAAGTSDDLFQAGAALMQSDQADDLLDAVRHQMERCDALETIHILADVDSMFGAIGAVALAQIRDEFCTRRQTLVALPVWNAGGVAVAFVNRAFSIAHLYESSDLIVLLPDRLVSSRALGIWSGSCCYRQARSDFSSADLRRALIAAQPDLPFASLTASILHEGEKGGGAGGRYRVAIGDGSDADCHIAGQAFLPPGPPFAPSSKRHVPAAVVADWMGAESVVDEVARLACVVRSLSAATAAARYAIDASLLAEVVETYEAVSDAVLASRSYRAL